MPLFTLPWCKRNTQFGIPLPHDTGARYLELRKEEGSSERQQIFPSCLCCLCSARGWGARAPLGPAFGTASSSASPKSCSPQARAALGASGIHLPWQGGTRQTRVAWVSSSGSCHLSVVFVSSEQDVGRCFFLV